MFSLLSSKPEVLFGNEPAQITVQNDDNDGFAHESLQTLLETRCKSIFLPFNPPWWLAKYVLSQTVIPISYLNPFQRPSADNLLCKWRLL